jgi:hypothetical protein
MGGVSGAAEQVLDRGQRKTLFTLVCSVCILSAGCTVQQPPVDSETPTAAPGTPTAVLTPTEPETTTATSTATLEERGTVSDSLLKFIEADNKSRAAEARGLEYRTENQTVSVRVRPTENQSVPTAYVSSVEYRFSDGRISGWVNASAIRSLGRSERVAFIRASPTVEQSSYEAE